MHKPFKLLVTSYDYRPRLGGVATCAYEMTRALSRLPDLEIRFIAPHSKSIQQDLKFDSHHFFSTRRIHLPSTATKAVVPFAAHLTNEILRWRPHAVLNFLWHPCAISTWMTAPVRKALGVPYFVIVHGVEVVESNHTLKKRLRSKFAWLKRAVLRDAAAVLPVSRFTGDLVHVDGGVPRDRIRVIHNGVDPLDFFPAPKPQDLIGKYGLDGKFVFLTVSRLEDYKGMDYALKALRQIVPEYPEVRYLICGEGPDRPRLERLVKEYGLSNHVIFAGVVPEGRLRDFYNLCDVFVLLTRDDRITPNLEGFGIVFLEAAACTKPSIGGRSGGIPDAIFENKTGWLVDPTDEFRIAQVMRESIKDIEKTQNYGKAALQRVLAKYTWNHVSKKVFAEISRECS